MKQLEEWDHEYLNEVASSKVDETARIERKSSPLFDAKSSRTKEELAKQVCAFANAGGGFVVFGIADAGGLDSGIEPLVGRQPVKDWVEAIIPKLLTPPVSGCEAKFICDPGFHHAGRGALVISIPSSDARPHWLSDHAPEVAYLRVGAHSGPMSLLTFQDLSSRGSTAAAEIDAPESWDVSARPDGVFLNPRVTLISGPVTELWTFVVKIPSGVGMLVAEWAKNALEAVGDELHFKPHQPLFPGNSTPIAAGAFGLAVRSGLPPEVTVEMRLCAGSARPVIRRYSIRSLQQIAHARDAARKQTGPGISTQLHSGG